MILPAMFPTGKCKPLAAPTRPRNHAVASGAARVTSASVAKLSDGPHGRGNPATQKWRGYDFYLAELEQPAEDLRRLKGQSETCLLRSLRLPLSCSSASRCRRSGRRGSASKSQG